MVARRSGDIYIYIYIYIYIQIHIHIGADHDEAAQVRLRTGRDHRHGEQKFSKVSALVLFFYVFQPLWRGLS